mgnify:CR=1 FL=1
MARPQRDVTDAELDVLKALWDGGERTIRQIADRLYPAGTASDYATVQKLLERLESKGFVARTKDGPAHRYAALVGRDELIGRRVQEVMDSLCGGSMTPLLTHLMSRRGLSVQERRALHDIVDRLSPSPKQRSPKRGG